MPPDAKILILSTGRDIKTRRGCLMRRYHKKKAGPPPHRPIHKVLPFLLQLHAARCSRPCFPTRAQGNSAGLMASRAIGKNKHAETIAAIRQNSSLQTDLVRCFYLLSQRFFIAEIFILALLSSIAAGQSAYGIPRVSTGQCYTL